MKDLKNPNKLHVPSNDFVANLNSIYNASLTATSYYVHNKVYVPSVELNPQLKLLFTNSIHRILYYLNNWFITKAFKISLFPSENNN